MSNVMLIYLDLQKYTKLGGAQMSHGSSASRKVNSPSSISAAERLEILVDYLHQHGSILSSADKLKDKGLHQAEPLSWTFADILIAA